MGFAELLKLKPESPTTDVDQDSVLWLLNDRLRLIHERQAELAHLDFDRLPEIERAERLAEQRDLQVAEQDTLLALRIERGEHDPDSSSAGRRRLRDIIDNETAAEIESKLRWIERLESEGDYRQARVHRMEILFLRAEKERQWDFQRRSTEKWVTSKPRL